MADKIMGSAKVFILGLVLLVQHVAFSVACVEKFVDGETAQTQHIVAVGQMVTLKCDVTARDPNRDLVFWKFGQEVMSQDNDVIQRYQPKFTVSLESVNGKDIYTIWWRAELSDAGQYICTCTTGGIQYSVSLIQVDASTNCVERFVFGETPETQYIVALGERMTLKCDVTGRNPSRDTLYWKFQNSSIFQVISQDQYKSKFNVSLANEFGKVIYTITWIAQSNDAGMYICTCLTGGIQFPVSIILIPEAPTISLTTPLSEGAELNVTCTKVGKVAVTEFEIYEGDTKLTTGITGTHNDTYKVAKVTKAEHDGKKYKCRAKNDIETSAFSAEKTLEVTDGAVSQLVSITTTTLVLVFGAFFKD